MNHSEACSCGESTDHEIARRVTADGKTFYVWSDGTLTWGDVGRTIIKGIGRSRARWSRRRDLRIATIIAAHDGVINSDEITDAFMTGRRFASQPGAWGANDSAWWSAIAGSIALRFPDRV